MNQIKLELTLVEFGTPEIEALVNLIKVVKPTAEATKTLKAEKVIVVEPTKEEPAIEESAKEEEKPKTKRRTKAEIEAEKKAAEKEEEEEAPEEVEEAKEEASEDEDEVTIEKIRALLAKKVAVGRKEIKAKLTELGCPNVTVMDKANYVEFYDFLESL